MLPTYNIVLGTTCMEITPEPVANNATELITKRHVTGVFPARYQVDNKGNTVTWIRMYFRHGKKHRYIDINCQQVANQATWSDGTLAGLQQALSDINDWLVIAGGSPMDGYGGTSMYRDGDYIVCEYKSSASFVCTRAGTGSYTDTEALIDAGGGGGSGAYGNGNGTGGGGGGGCLVINAPLTVGSYPFTIGAGGPRGVGTTVFNASNLGTQGSNSTAFGYTAIGGGFGGAIGLSGQNGGNGGNGGGGSANGVGGTGSQGFDGGAGVTADPYKGGGGGGASQDGVDGSVSGKGGDGLTSLISGASATYSGGGGGGTFFSAGYNGGVGGTGGGGTGGGAGALNATNGTINTGGGGGGGAWHGSPGVLSGNGGNGGSGIAYNKFYNPSPFAGIQSLFEYEGNLNDSIAQTANNGTLNIGTVTYPAGMSGTCRRLSAGGRIVHTPFGITGKRDFTVLAWIKLTNLATHVSILGFGEENNDKSVFLFVNSSGKVVFDLYGRLGVVGATSVDDNTWRLIGFTNSNGVINVHVNGVVDSAGANLTAVMNLGNTYAWEGRVYSADGGSGQFDMDKLMVIPRLLSNAEMLEIYNAGAGLPYY
jgi:hypothetical protein